MSRSGSAPPRQSRPGAFRLIDSIDRGGRNRLDVHVGNVLALSRVASRTSRRHSELGGRRAWRGRSMAAEPILVTGAAGFIGFHVAQRLAAAGRAVIGIDNLNAYYDPALKQARLAELARYDCFRFHKLDLKDRDAVAALFAQYRFVHVVHLAAQAGVRHSL